MKAVYKVIDNQGRIVIPKEIRDKLHINQGDIVEIKIEKENIKIEKLDIIQLNNDSIESFINTMIASAKKMDKESLLRIMGRLFENFKDIEFKEGNHE